MKLIYIERQTQEEVEVEAPISESVVEFTRKDGSKHQLMRSTFDGQFFAKELPRPSLDHLDPTRVNPQPGSPVAMLAAEAPKWMEEQHQEVVAELSQLKNALERIEKMVESGVNKLLGQG